MTNPNTEEEKKTTNIVVGIENDTTGNEAFARAVAIAELSDDVRLHICHCVGDKDGNVADKLTVGERLLRSWAAKQLIGTQLIGRTTLHVDVGTPADVLRQLAIDVEADMIVIGTHHKKLLRRVLDGSVVQSLLADAPCAVMVASPPDYEADEKSPRIEDPLPKHAASRTLGMAHRYHYRRSVPLNPPMSTIGAGTATRRF